MAERTRENRQAAARTLHASRSLEATSELLEDERDTMMAVSADMTRQYKTMESQLAAKISELEARTRVLEKELEMTCETLEETKAKAAKTITEKNEEITMLRHKVRSMEAAYEGILIEALDTMASRIDEARDKWEIESLMVQQRNKDALLDFGLSHSVVI